MADYNVSSVQTKYYIVSDGSENPGDRVVTVPDSEVNPDTITVTISPELGDNTLAIVRGKAGFFVSVNMNVEGQYLVWSPRPYQWHFAANGPPGALSVHVPNEDLYWFDKFNVGIGRGIILKPGRDAQEEEIYFNFVEI